MRVVVNGINGLIKVLECFIGRVMVFGDVGLEARQLQYISGSFVSHSNVEYRIVRARLAIKGRSARVPLD